mgnify:CR=1 FL=1|tara:strand:+ start:528 stop:860 length:333 start_codon:yes stop_codon:yes gene_type:complete
MSKKKYYPNNWRVVKSAPDEMFPSISYEEFMEWKIAGWELPSSVGAVIRTQHLETGKVNEYVYQLPAYAKKRVRKLMDEGECEITVCTHSAIHFICLEDSDFDDDESDYA